MTTASSFNIPGKDRKSTASSRRLTSVSGSPEGSSLLWWTDFRIVASVCGNVRVKHID